MNVKDYSFFNENAGIISKDLNEERQKDDVVHTELFSRIRNHFEGNVAPFYAPDRDTALALALAAAAGESSAFLCSRTSYAACKGRASIERIAGMKPVGISSHFGKLEPETILQSPEALPDDESGRCSVLVLSQPTEYGLVYTPEEIGEICRCAHEQGMLVLVDGSRLFFAAARLLKAFREQTLYAGVDLAIFGAEKNGVAGGEAVLIFKSEIRERYRDIQEKVRIDLSGAEAFSSGFHILLTHRLWRFRALHANEMAAHLGRELSCIPGIRLLCDVETNKVIAEVPPEILRRLKEKYCLRTFSCPADTVGFVTNYTTTKEDIHQLIAALQ